MHSTDRVLLASANASFHTAAVAGQIMLGGCLIGAAIAWREHPQNLRLRLIFMCLAILQTVVAVGLVVAS
jgi:hypothetical protein